MRSTPAGPARGRIVAEWTGDMLGDAPQGAPAGRLQRAAGCPDAQLQSPRCAPATSATVRDIGWSRGAVRVAASSPACRFKARAARAIVTAAPGSTAAGTGHRRRGAASRRRLPRSRRALACLPPARIVKMVLRFRCPSGNSCTTGATATRASSMPRGPPMPTFWTQGPVSAAPAGRLGRRAARAQARAGRTRPSCAPPSKHLRPRCRRGGRAAGLLLP